MNEDDFPKELEVLKADIEFYNDSIKEVAVDMMAEGFSKHPIFVAHQHEVKLGELILDIKDYARDHHINATTLEELVEKQVIEQHKVEEFKAAYKDPRKFICIFWVRPQGAYFIYIPYKKKR